MVVGIVPVREKGSVVLRPQAFVAQVAEESEIGLPRQDEAVVSVREPIQSRSVVIPTIVRVQSRPVPLQPLALGMKAPQRELIDASDIRASKETRRGLEVFRRIRIFRVVPPVRGTVFLKQ